MEAAYQFAANPDREDVDWSALVGLFECGHDVRADEVWRQRASLDLPSRTVRSIVAPVCAPMALVRLLGKASISTSAGKTRTQERRAYLRAPLATMLCIGVQIKRANEKAYGVRTLHAAPNRGLCSHRRQ